MILQEAKRLQEAIESSSAQLSRKSEKDMSDFHSNALEVMKRNYPSCFKEAEDECLKKINENFVFKDIVFEEDKLENSISYLMKLIRNYIRTVKVPISEEKWKDL